jgi:hypothetical protein
MGKELLLRSHLRTGVRPAQPSLAQQHGVFLRTFTLRYYCQQRDNTLARPHQQQSLSVATAALMLGRIRVTDMYSSEQRRLSILL